MGKKYTTYRNVRFQIWSTILLFGLLFFEVFHVSAQATRQFTTTVTTQSNVFNATNAIDTDLNTFARVEAYSGLALGLGAYSGTLELQFPTTLPANTTSYVKVEVDSDLFNALLGGSLGGLLADVLNLVIGGEQVIEVQARNGTTIVAAAQTNDPADFAGNVFKVVQDVAGNIYFAITPTASYNRIRLINNPGAALLLGTFKDLRVFDAFTITSPDICGSPSFTSFDGTGLTLDLLGIGGAGVINGENSIDGDTLTASSISLGLAGVGATIQQNVFFEGQSSSTDQIIVRLGVSTALLNVGLLDNIEIITLNNGVVVTTAAASTLLGLDLLGLLQANQVVEIPISPGAPVDQVVVRLSALVDASIAQTVNLFEVTRVPGPPTNTTLVGNLTICEGQTTTLTATTAAGNELLWYTSPLGGTPVATTASGVGFTTGVLSTTTTFYVAARTIGCTEESERIAITVNVTPAPAVPTTSNTTPSFCTITNPTLATISLNETSIVWYDAAIGGNLLPTSTLLVNGATYYAAQVNTTTGCESISRLAISTTLSIDLCDTDGDGILDGVDVCPLVPGLAPNGCPAVLVSAKAFLQGALSISTNPYLVNSDNLMRDDLRVAGVLPTTEPYTLFGFSDVTSGGAVTTAFGTVGSNAIVDWVLVELRSASDAALVVARRAGLIQRDGDIVEMDGVSPLAIPIAAGDYFVSIRHRNHIGAMTASVVSLREIATAIDFTSGSVATFGTNAQVTIGGVLALMAGNTNGDGLVIAQGPSSDRTSVVARIIGEATNALGVTTFILAGYENADANMNSTAIAQGVGSDNTYILNLVLNSAQNVSALMNFILTEQIP